MTKHQSMVYLGSLHLIINYNFCCGNSPFLKGKRHSVKPLPEMLTVEAPHVAYSTDSITAEFSCETTTVQQQGDDLVATPSTRRYALQTARTVPHMGLMLVGWGGNNGSTVSGAIVANRHKLAWRSKTGEHHPSFLGSLVQASTCRLGCDSEGNAVHVPVSQLLPLVSPNDLVLGGWDISKLNLAESVQRAQVFDYDLQLKLEPYLKSMVPLPSVYRPGFIAANQESRADNILKGSLSVQLEELRRNIREFKAKHSLDCVTVMWTATTEKCVPITKGFNDTAANILAAIKADHELVAPSALFAVAAIQEKSAFINGAPQNTLTPAILELASINGVHVAGDDFKSGQTKLKSVLVDFLVSAGIKPLAITSYNHLGNNDGHNLSQEEQFRSKELSKSNCISDVVDSNHILYPRSSTKGTPSDDHNTVDHTVVIKYVPTVADDKRAIDEYVSELFMGGRSIISIYNVCPDSLLAAPLILDLCILTELFSRIKIKELAHGEKVSDSLDGFEQMDNVLGILGYFLKAPVVRPGDLVVNALAQQRQCIINLMRACIGLAPEHYMHTGVFRN